MKSASSNVAIIGAGIVGLAHAWSAAKRGQRVTVFERDAHACGASVRNFGMIWPIGQPQGECRDIALASRRAWLELGREAGIWVSPCGSIHLAHRDDEWAVLEEFQAHASQQGYECELLTAAEVAARTPAANLENLHGGLFSPTELCVNPRAALREIPTRLARRFHVDFQWNTTITAVEPGQLRMANREWFRADKIIVCGGADCAALFPDIVAQAGLRRCKLQMLKTVAQSSGWRLGPHLAGGLTLRHYQNFAVCKSLTALKQRIAAETPELDRFGIHVMASQNEQGEVILGDSHEYDQAIEPFDKAAIDDLMLRELHRLIRLPDWTIAERWHGVYVKQTSEPLFEAEPLPGVLISTGTGGAGMTMAFGLAERAWSPNLKLKSEISNLKSQI